MRNEKASVWGGEGTGLEEKDRSREGARSENNLATVCYTDI